MMAVRTPTQCSSQIGPLSVLVEQRRTGELVCANGGIEVHVYMQEGRVAWGTDSERPLAFGRYLTSECGVGRDELAAFVVECRREKKALGEALVRSGRVTTAQVREALRHQAALAVRALLRMPSGSAAFFERKGFATYARELTFSLEELLQEDRPSTVHNLPRPSAPPSRAKGHASSVVREVHGCEWAEHYKGTVLLEHQGHASEHPQTPEPLLVQLADGSVDFVAVRSGAGAILGANLPDASESVWCGVREDAPFGSGYAVFGRLCGLERRSNACKKTAAQPELRLLEDRGTSFASTALELMKRVPDVLAVCHLVGDTPSTLVTRCGHEDDLRPARVRGFAEGVFALEVLAEPVARVSGRVELGLRTAVLGDVDTWTYGAELSVVTSETLWLTTSRRTAQGFGWACLTAVVRELEML
jgi:hypothetical protein